MLKSLIKHYMPRGFGLALRATFNEALIWGRHWRSSRKAHALYSGARGLKLNIGCGPHHKAGWVNIDLHDGDLKLDMREHIPLPDGSVSIIYSEHFFEHLDYPIEAFRFLSESYRVLECSGRFSVGVPDTEWPLLEYAGKSSGWLESSRRWHPDWAKTILDRINFHFRQAGEHRYAYDLESLRFALESIGFVNIKRRDFDPAIDSESRRIGTLYVEAIKP
jgi:predicted SAM-dependent methyltransferase